MVPESSERWKAWMSAAGSVTPGLRAAIAGSFHLVICESKILAVVGPSSVSLSTPSTLKTIEIRPATIGRSMPWPPVQTALVASTSAGLSAESEPANWTLPWVNCCTPAPEPPPA